MQKWEKLHILEKWKNTHFWKFCKGIKRAKWPNMANFGDEI